MWLTLKRVCLDKVKEKEESKQALILNCVIGRIVMLIVVNFNIQVEEYT